MPSTVAEPNLWTSYRSPGCFDEMLRDGEPWPSTERVLSGLRLLGPELLDRQSAADQAIKSMGVTFRVYSRFGALDRDWPFDVIPRVISSREWSRVSQGLIQRLEALNLFLDDIYHDARVVSDGVFPGELLASSRNYLPECRGTKLRFGTWAHICGSDLVRGVDGQLHVLEDNLRVPSGVSYMMENRRVTKMVLADLFHDLDVLPIEEYPNRLRDVLAALSPRSTEQPTICVLTPGVFNSAYFEHAFLARQMGAHLVEGRDLFVDANDTVQMNSVGGPLRVDVLYRRVDDVFLDPEVFRADSLLGVPGLMRAWTAGNVSIANAPGTGIADDKVTYAYVPELIRYYLGEDPILPNVETYVCHDPTQRNHVLANLAQLVVKPANGSGGYDIFVGDIATAAECDTMRAQIEEDPRNFVAQPIIRLSTGPTLCEGEVAPRHLDLRPFVLSGEQPFVTSGGLTRVAMTKGCLVVNSSQGGGSKDTWVINDGY